MNLDALFEDLESQLTDVTQCFENQKQMANCNRFLLQIGNHNVSLIAPIIGKDFVAGYHAQRAAWMCVAMPKVSVLKFACEPDTRLPRLRRRTTALEEFLREMTLPYAVELKPCGQPEFAAVLTAIDEQLLCFKLPAHSGAHAKDLQAAAISSLDWVAIVDAKDSSDVASWRKR
jgi:hypothetical protein